MLTLAQPHSDTNASIITYAQPAAAPATTDLHPLSIFGPPTLPYIQNPNHHPTSINRDHNSIIHSNQLPMTTLQGTQVGNKLPQFQAAMQLYNETLNEFYRLRNQLNHQSTRIQPHATQTNESIFHQTNQMRNQEEYQSQAQTPYGSTSHDVQYTTGLLDRPANDAEMKLKARSDNNIQPLATSNHYSNSGGSFYDVNGSANLVWGNNDVHDDGSISDESLNRDWGLQKKN
jgi:hypothetical protein